MKILVGVDGSAGGFAAVRFVGRLLSPVSPTRAAGGTAGDEGRVGLFYTPPEVRLRPPGDDMPQAIRRAQQALAEAVFDEARRQLPSRLAAEAHTITGSGNPRQGLLDAARDWKADVLAVGARGSGPIRKLLLGSVAETIAHTARLPVLVVRPTPAESADHPLRVLLAWDGSPESRRASSLLGRFDWPEGTVGRVITVIESLPTGELPRWLEKKTRSPDTEAMVQAWVQEHEAEREQKQQELSGICGELPPAFQSGPILAEGHAAEQILATIAAEKIDLAVLGTHGSWAVERLLIGSTSDKVLSQAPCSVLLVRERLEL